MDLPHPDLIGGAITAVVGIIVIIDIWLIWRRHETIPHLGPLDGGGFAWATTTEQEMARHWSSMLALAFMMAAPWVLAETSGTSTWIIILFDVLLLIHLAGMLSPKRYAVSRTHLFCDGQIMEWSGLRLAIKQPRGRILLQRRGWSIFAPLPLGGQVDDLGPARLWIAAAMAGDEAWAECQDHFQVEEE